MTVHEIAETAGVHPDTVRRAIKERYPDKQQNGKQTHLGYHEAIAIVGDIRKKGYILPSQNTELPSQNAKAGKLPAGIQLRELRLIYGPEEAGRRLDTIMGYPGRPREPAAIAAPVIINLGNLSKPAIAVEMKERAKAEAKETARRLNGDLFKDAP